MAILLYRVDERLIHGQVVIGWGSQLRPDLIVVVDDELATSEWEQELYTLGLPPEISAEFRSVDEARADLDAWRESRERVILLVRDLATIARLAEGGLLVGEEINLGGIHAAPGRRGILPYLFLSAEDEEILAELAASGHEVSARDLPNSRPVGAGEILGSESSRDPRGRGAGR